MSEQELLDLARQAKLTNLEVQQLLVLWRAGDRGMTPYEILDALYGDRILDVKNIHVRMHRIRRKLRAIGAPWFIPSLWPGMTPRGASKQRYKLERIKGHENQAQPFSSQGKPAFEEAPRPAREADGADQGVGDPQGSQG